MSQIRSFDFSFDVRAPLPAVAAFHRHPSALARLTPPPLLLRVRHAEPLAEGSAADFTLWFGPLPVRWTAIHSAVDDERGFTDTQAAGPLKFWRHQHRFEAIDPQTTRVHDHVEYGHHSGWRGWLTNLAFNPLALRLLFSYRRLVTQRAVTGGDRRPLTSG
jgi:ligand-binding SRPBCC domain-containing protein